MSNLYYTAETVNNNLFSSGSPGSVALGIVLLYLIIIVAIALIFFSILSFVISRSVEKGIARYVEKNKDKDLSYIDSHIVGSIIEANNIINSDNIRNNKDK